jgi:hypothetical protein
VAFISIYDKDSSIWDRVYMAQVPF